MPRRKQEILTELKEGKIMPEVTDFAHKQGESLKLCLVERHDGNMRVTITAANATAVWKLVMERVLVCDFYLIPFHISYCLIALQS
jgi:hypothetical protein